MDDLLSVALSEAGLDEFLVNASPCSSTASLPATTTTGTDVSLEGQDGIPPFTPSTAVDTAQVVPSSGTSAADKVNSTTVVEQCSPSITEPGSSSNSNDGVPVDVSQQEVVMTSPEPDMPSPRVSFASTSIANRHTVSPASTSSPQFRVRETVPPKIRTIPRSSTLATPVGKQTTIRTVAGNGGTMPSPGQLIQRTVQTPTGPQMQVLRADRNEKGEQVFRCVRMYPCTEASTSQQTETLSSPRVVIVRQNTPTGPIFVKKRMPAGATISTYSRGGTVVRKVVSARPGTVLGTVSTPPTSVARSVTPMSELHVDTRMSPVVQRVSTMSPVARGGGPTRVMRGGHMVARGGHMSRGSGVYRSSPQLAKTASSPGMYVSPISRSASPFAAAARNVVNQRELRLTRANEQNHEYGSMSMSSISEKQGLMRVDSRPQSPLVSRSPLRPESARGGRVAAEGGSLPRRASVACTPTRDNFELQPLEPANYRNPISQQTKPVTPNVPKQPPQPPTKSQKAKEDMKAAMQSAGERRREMDDDEENLGYAETYAEYRPTKLRSGLAHPDSVVETASLSSVQPPDVRYQISIPEFLIDTGAVSALQLEAVIYACQAHERRLPSGERVGYLIGDGAGVGKGRTVACIIFENYVLGRKRAIWLSVSSDLKFDSERDLRDIGAKNIKVHALNKMKYSKINGKENGSVKKGVVFATYSSLIGECRDAKTKYRSRLKLLVQWFGVNYDGVIILDECHRAKNLLPSAGGTGTKTGKMVLELQRLLPNARVVYASATGATEPRNMAYMSRLGLWGQGQAFPDFTAFINAVEKRGVGAMEIVAMDMKQRGLYLARQLSFRGVTFRVEEVALSEAFVKAYDDSVKLWMECRRQFQAVLATMTDEERSGCKQVWGQFWASHQRFFKYFCIAAKVETCVRIAREAVADGKCIVIGLQSTGESRTLEALEEMGGELNEFVSTTKAVLQSLIEKHFPTERGSCVDVFKDFDRLCNEFDKPAKKRKRAQGFDILDELGLSFGPVVDKKEPSIKRSRRGSGETNGGGGAAATGSDDNSTTTSSGGETDDSGDEDDEDDDIGVCSSSDGEDDVNLGDNEEDWLKALMAEAESSSSEEDEDEADGAETENETKPDEQTCQNFAEEEFNPFACDFSQDDPWAAKQQVVDDTPKKVKQRRPEEMAAIRRRKKEKKRRQKMRLKREKIREERRKVLKQVESQAQKDTASTFISSSRIIDEPTESINPTIVKTELLAAVERLGPSLPANTLDQLIDELGGPEYVAEMTGRKGRIVTRDDGEVVYELRHEAGDVPLELMNMDEKDKFMKGAKVIAVISEAASSGISLQSDRRALNQRRRVHVTLELPWSADKAIQQFGRTHRSNQVSAPEYIFLISELAGEKRFASIVAKRLESLGALTHGDRRATESRDLSQFNLDTKYGRAALEVLMKSVIGTLNPPLIPPPEDYKPGNFFDDMRLYIEGVGLLSRLDTGGYVMERESQSISKFLNRILGLPVHAQNALFHYFTEIVTELVAQAKHDGTYDMGIMDLGTGGDLVRKTQTRVFLGRQDKGSFRVEMHKIGVERGVNWEDALALYNEHNTHEDGFYASAAGHGKKVAVLVYGIGKRRLDSGARLFAITRPSTGRSPKLETQVDLNKKYEKISCEEAKELWNDQYEGAGKMCQHTYRHGKCKQETTGQYCELGRRQRTYFVLSGSVLSVWPVVEETLSGGRSDRDGSRMQIIRVRTETDHKIVGLLVLPQYVRPLVDKLEEHCGRCIVESSKDEPMSASSSPKAPKSEDVRPLLDMKTDDLD